MKKIVLFKNMLIAVFTAAISLSPLTSVAEESDTSKLQSLLKQMSSIKARFVQHSFDGKGGLLQTLEGELMAKAPGKFKWKTEPPYEQLMVTNGETLWLYDEDLEQVTVQALDKRVEATPALLLTGELDQINQAYEVFAEQLQEEWHFVLLPKTPDALFDRLRLEFDENKSLKRMIIKDEIGQKTILSFSKVQHNLNIANKDFDFVPPEGVDVISQGDMGLQ